jgi:hypothetical protein
LIVVTELNGVYHSFEEPQKGVKKYVPIKESNTQSSSINNITNSTAVNCCTIKATNVILHWSGFCPDTNEARSLHRKICPHIPSGLFFKFQKFVWKKSGIRGSKLKNLSDKPSGLATYIRGSSSTLLGNSGLAI